MLDEIAPSKCACSDIYRPWPIQARRAAANPWTNPIEALNSSFTLISVHFLIFKLRRLLQARAPSPGHVFASHGSFLKIREMSHQNIDHGQTTRKEDSIPVETSPSISATGSVQSDLEIKASSLSTSFEQSIPFGYKVKLAETEFMSDTELNTRYTHPKRRWLHSKDYSSLSRYTKSTDNSETSIFSKASLPLTPFSNQVSFSWIY